MKAKMRDNLVERYKALAPSIVDIPDEEIRDFLSSIEGRVVELVFTGPDAFEKEDNNIWLPDCLWDEVDTKQTTQPQVDYERRQLIFKKF